jgi:hypothetical protein
MSLKLPVLESSFCALQQLNPEQLKQIEEMMQRNLPVPDTENED